MNPKLRKILLFASILAVLLVGYVIFSKKEPAKSTGSLSSTTGVANVAGSNVQNNTLGQEFLNSLLNLKKITLDQTIFTSKTFTNLQDFTNVVSNTDPQGRQNPFAPLGVDAAATLTSDGTGASPEVSSVTTQAAIVTKTTSRLNGTLAAVDSGTRFFEWGLTEELGNTTTPITASGDTWTTKITGLTPATSYSYRAAAKVGTITFYGSIITFTTLP